MQVQLRFAGNEDLSAVLPLGRQIPLPLMTYGKVIVYVRRAAPAVWWQLALAFVYCSFTYSSNVYCMTLFQVLW